MSYVGQEEEIFEFFREVRKAWQEDRPTLELFTISDCAWSVALMHRLTSQAFRYPMQLKLVGDDVLELTFVDEEGPSFIFTEETCEWYHCPSLSRQNMIEMDLEDLQLQVERDSVLRMGVSR